MSAPPVTALVAEPAEAEAIRRQVRQPDLAALGLGRRIATPDDAALDNVRSARLIDAAGFVRMGERDSVRPDGTVRRSLYWELTREAWRARAA